MWWFGPYTLCIPCLPNNASVSFINSIRGGVDPTQIVHAKNTFEHHQGKVSSVVCSGLDPTHIVHTKNQLNEIINIPLWLFLRGSGSAFSLFVFFTHLDALFVADFFGVVFLVRQLLRHAHTFAFAKWLS